MLCNKETYGDDIDGNRGVKQFIVEVEQSDLEDIVEALYEGFLEDNTTGTQTILLYCATAGEDIEVEVEIDDYIENLIEKADEDEDIKDDECLQYWLKKLKEKTISGVLIIYQDSAMSLSCDGSVKIIKGIVQEVNFKGYPRANGDGWTAFFKRIKKGDKVDIKKINQMLTYNNQYNVIAKFKERCAK